MLRLMLVHALAALPLERIHRVFEQARLARTCRRLAHFGDRVTISHGLYVELPNAVRIEDDVSFGPDVKVMGAGGCTLGQGTMIATGVLILTTMHDRRAADMRVTSIHRPVVVERDCWIGAGAILLPGAHVRSGAVIGAGAVVSGEIPAGYVAMGIPARALYERRDIAT